LDEQLRPEVYAEGGPAEVNIQAQSAMSEMGIVDSYYDGDYAGDIFAAQRAEAQAAQTQSNDDLGVQSEGTSGDDTSTAPSDGASLPSDTETVTASSAPLPSSGNSTADIQRFNAANPSQSSASNRDVIAQRPDNPTDRAQTPADNETGGTFEGQAAPANPGDLGILSTSDD